MSEEIKRVLNALVNQQRIVSVAHLATRLNIDSRRVQKILEMLERAGYVRTRRRDRVVLVALTSLGYEKANALRTEELAGPTHMTRPTLVILASGALLTFLIAVAWWWLDLIPTTGEVTSIDAAPLPSATPLPPDTIVPSPTDTPVLNPQDTPTVVPATSTPTPNGPGPLPTAVPISTPDSYAFIPTPVPLVEQPPKAVNIVLMGTDTTRGSWRTDTLIIVSVDPDLPSVSMLSIPRDLYVYIPGWKMERINAADYHGERVSYPGGGPGLVKATIEYNLGVRVHYFARADFGGFVKILDTLGGVDVVIDCELHDTFPDPDAPTGSTDIDLLPGVHHLAGKEALWYARSRWNTSDFDRGRRQQRVLRGALARIKQLELLPKLPELWDDLTQTVQTDLSLETALWLAGIAGRLDTATAIKSRFIDNTVVRDWRSPEGAAVLLPAYERIGTLIADVLAPPDTARARQGMARVEVLNGTTWPNWAILAADRLAWEGFDVVSIGQADRTDYGQTVVIDITETDKGSPASQLAKILKASDANILPADAPNAELDFRVIVGHNYEPCYRSYWRAVHAPTPTPTQ